MWLRKSFLDSADYRKAIDLQTDCNIIKGIIDDAWKDKGKNFVERKDPEEELSSSNRRIPLQQEWESLINHARNKCATIDPKYFLKDPDPESALNGTVPEPLYTTK